MPKLTEGKLAKLNVLAEQGFSNGEIARAIGVSTETVRKYRGEKNVEKTTRSKKAAGKRKRDRDPSDNKRQDRGRESDDPGESIDSPGETKTLVFVGGKRYMGKKEESITKEEDQYQCYNCGHIQGSPFSECPKCGSTNVFED